MKRVVVTGVLALLGGCGLMSPLDVYDLPVDQVYKKLADLDTEAVEGPFQIEDGIILTTKDKRELRWRATKRGSEACTATLSPIEETKTRVAISCTSEGSMPGTSARDKRMEVIELVDSTLRGRPYDRKGAAATAARYPADVVKHAGFAQEFGQVYANGIKTAVETQRMLNDIERETATTPDAPPPPRSALDFQKPGEPSLKLD